MALNRLGIDGMDTRYLMLVAAIERAINEADPIGLLEIGAPTDEYGPDLRRAAFAHASYRRSVSFGLASRAKAAFAHAR